jgi:hypothetical protein
VVLVAGGLVPCGHSICGVIISTDGSACGAQIRAIAGSDRILSTETCSPPGYFRHERQSGWRGQMNTGLIHLMKTEWFTGNPAYSISS